MTIELEQFRTAARILKKQYRSGDEDAIARVLAILPDATQAKHADFLHVIARESGFASWPRLKHNLELASMTRDQRAEKLKMALYFGQNWMIEKLLLDDPTLKDHNLGLQVALYDRQAVIQALQKDPQSATRKIGPRTPILHLAYSKYIHMAPEKAGDMIDIAERLVSLGADVNDGFAPDPSSDHRISALYGALGHANNMRLANWLLNHGASPDDNESLYHATELGHTDGLALLIEHGAETRGTNALARALDFKDLDSVRMLLEHGADPNEAVVDHPSGEAIDGVPALHQAARRWCSAEIAGVLLEFGSDPLAVWKGHTPFGVAEIYGNQPIAEFLERQGFATPLSDVEKQLAACAKGRSSATPIALTDLGEEARHLLTRLSARPDTVRHIRALVESGLDPNQVDEMRMSPLHIAGWHGFADLVAYFLTLDPDLSYENDFGGDALDTIVHGSEFAPKASESNHILCAQLVLDAGATLYRHYLDGTGNEPMARFLENRLEEQEDTTATPSGPS